MRFTHVLALAGVFAATRPAAADHLDISVAPAMREYCHIVQFSQGWKVPIELGKSSTELGNIYHYEYDDDYEFRIPGLQGTKFLVAGLIHLPARRYTTNRYEVDLSDSKAPALPATDRAWQEATPVALKQKRVVVLTSELVGNQALQFNGFQFMKSGDFWSHENSRQSPDGTWLVLQSTSGRREIAGETTTSSCFPFGCRGQIFLDVFNADTGKKLLTIKGTYSGGDTDGLLTKTGWLTERYFIVPIGEHRERCLVCEFGGKIQREFKP